MSGHQYRFWGHDHGTHWELAPDEWHHARRVLRLSPGAQVEVLDGSGVVVVGLLGADGRVEPLAHRPPDVPSWELHLALGVFRSGSVEAVLPGLCEIGVGAVHLFSQAHTPDHVWGDRVRQRWDKVLRASVKQCKRATLPSVHVYSGLGDCLASYSIRPGEIAVFACEQTACEPFLLPAGPAPALNRGLCVLGSEMGLLPAERQLCINAGLAPVSLGPYVLRASTAALCGAHWLGGLLEGRTPLLRGSSSQA